MTNITTKIWALRIRFHPDGGWYVQEGYPATKAKLLRNIQTNLENPKNKAWEIQIFHPDSGRIIWHHLPGGNISWITSSWRRQCQFRHPSLFPATPDINQSESKTS